MSYYSNKSTSLLKNRLLPSVHAPYGTKTTKNLSAGCMHSMLVSHGEVLWCDVSQTADDNAHRLKIVINRRLDTGKLSTKAGFKCGILHNFLNAR